MEAGFVKDAGNVMYTRSVADAGTVTKVNALGEHGDVVGGGLADCLLHALKCLII